MTVPEYSRLRGGGRREGMDTLVEAVDEGPLPGGPHGLFPEGPLVQGLLPDSALWGVDHPDDPALPIICHDAWAQKVMQVFVCQ